MFQGREGHRRMTCDIRPKEVPRADNRDVQWLPTQAYQSHDRACLRSDTGLATAAENCNLFIPRNV
jgi:hypothetical protein